MPIKRIEQQLAAQGVLGNFPRFGKLRKGGEKTEKSSGRDLDHFRLTLEPQYEEIIRPAFVQLFGEQPAEFNGVFIAADSADNAFQYWLEEWAHARLLRRCDGEEIVVQFSEGEQRYDTTPHACTCNPLAPACNQRGHMDIVIPAIFEATGMWGKFTIETGSVYDIIALRSSMRVASAFTANLPNVAFWSIPFRVGRALRKVPITINGKRSIKPMSLLYADIEPEFNQKVFAPMLTAPSQRLLAGVNPETGELPEIEIEQQRAWDRDYINTQTLHQFDHENHQMNTIDKMIANGDLTDEMNDFQAIDAINNNRIQRNAEKKVAEIIDENARKSRAKGSKPSAAAEQAQPGADWTHDPQIVGKFLAQAQAKLNLNHGQVIDALKWISFDPIQNVDHFDGTKDDAWAACVAMHCDYDLDKVAAFIPKVDSPLRLRVIEIIEASAIPF
jgi:hypothetical protein